MIKLLPNRRDLMLLSVLLCAPATCWSQERTTETSPPSQATMGPREKHDALQFVSIPTRALPEHVRLVERIRTAPIISVTQNPDVFVDQQRIKQIAAFFGMLAKAELKPVRAGVVAMYQENDPANEIGVYGLSFSDERAARIQFKRLTMEKEDSRFYLKGTLLLYVWKDDAVSNRAFEAIQKYFKSAKFEPVQHPEAAPSDETDSRK